MGKWKDYIGFQQAKEKEGREACVWWEGEGPLSPLIQSQSNLKINLIMWSVCNIHGLGISVGLSLSNLNGS